MQDVPSTPQAARLHVPPSRKVLLCVGPGGVGKTTVAASIGLAEARKGRRVIVVTIDPSRRLAQALGLSEQTSGVPSSVPVPGSDQPLDCLLLDTRRVFDEIVRGYSKSADAASRMLANPIYQATVDHLGGALEFAAIARVHMLVAKADYDVIILDTPPTANALEFLEAPVRISELLNNPAAKFLAASSRVSMKFFGLASNVMLKAFEAMGGGPFVGQLGAFLGDFGAVLSEFQRRAGDVAQLLVSQDTGVVLATSATEFSVREAREFLDVLRSRKMNIDGVVLNRVDPRLAPPPDREAFAGEFGARHDAAAVDKIAEIYGKAFLQSQRARRVQVDLEARYPDIRVSAIPRMSPPPIGVADLTAMGARLCE